VSVRHPLKALVRLVAMLWLATMVAAPAVAELGCIQETASHLQLCSTHNHTSISAPDDTGGADEAQATGHCASGHSACGGMLVGATESEEPAVAVLTFVSATVRELPPVAVAGQERPPKA
jgi:hypothetical protein